MSPRAAAAPDKAERDVPVEYGGFEDPDGEHSGVAVLSRGGDRTVVEFLRCAVGAPAVAGGGERP